MNDYTFVLDNGSEITIQASTLAEAEGKADTIEEVRENSLASVVKWYTRDASREIPRGEK